MAFVNVILNKMCLELKNIPMKVLCIMLVILQSFFMDVIIINCYGTGPGGEDECKHCKLCYWWIAGDALIVAGFIVTFVVSYKHLEYYSNSRRLNKKHMSYGVPLSAIVWFIYSSYLSAKVAVIFITAIDDKLKSTDFYGPQFLKTGICLSGVVFILFVASHHKAKENSKERMYITSVSSGITFDVLDTVDFLDVLFVNETGLILSYPLERAILAIAILNLLRPTFSFILIILNHFNATKLSRELSAANAVVYIFFVNVPFMAVRMYLWHNLDSDMSVFLVKNFVMIFIGLNELHEISLEKTQEQDSSVIEMTPRLTTAHRPTDLVDSSPEGPPQYTDALVNRNETADV
ncbi:uncharacterized protein [Watersipora subatra]|uniref:uncharacterized protein n=1 Tax=Watersipora subatra TaxID=2589382 RepID=UPI00355AE7BB